MERNLSNSQKLFLGLIVLFGWFAVITQLYLNINSHVAAFTEILIRFFSYFTIDTNIIVTFCCTVLLIWPHTSIGKFFSKQSTIAAIAVYILVVGCIYNIVLRSLWNPQGIQYIVDELLHTINPVLFILYWLIFIPKQELEPRHAFYWMIYPLIYGIFILTRGYFSSPAFYPYPFIDISLIGINKGIFNTLGFTFLFFLLSLLFIGIGKFLSREHKNVK